MSQMENSLCVTLDIDEKSLIYFFLLKEDKFRWYGPWFDTNIRRRRTYLENDGNIDKDDFINCRLVSLFEIEYYGLNDIFNKWI